MTDTVAWQSMLNQVREERDALVAKLEHTKALWHERGTTSRLQVVRIRAFEAKLQHWLNAYGSTDALSCDTRDLLATAETAAQSCPICSAIGGHLVSCERWELLGSTAETKGDAT